MNLNNYKKYHFNSYNLSSLGIFS